MLLRRCTAVALFIQKHCLVKGRTALSDEGVLAAREVSYAFGSHRVLRRASIRIARGEVVGLRGASGSGKSTLARLLCGLLSPQDGIVTADGAQVVARRGSLSGDVAMLFQSPRRSCNPAMTLRSVIEEGTRKSNTDVSALAGESGLHVSLLGRLPDEVSDGQLQRAALARCLAQNPNYLICDEATAMLDAGTTQLVVETIDRRVSEGLGVLIISHHEPLLDGWADRVEDLAAIQTP